MNKMIAVVTLSVALVVGVVSCQSNEQAGTVFGGVAGGLLGSQVGKGSGRTAAIIGGAVLGSYLGNQVGQRMDQVDRMRMQQATHRALDNNRSQSWQTDNARGYVRPGHQYTGPDGQQCRRFKSDIRIKGDDRWTQAYGCACRDRNGQWQIVSRNHCRR